MPGLDADELADLENSSTDAGTDFSGNIDASYEKPALDKAAAESQASESDAETESSGSGQEEGEEPDSLYRDEGKKGTGKKRITKRKKLLGGGAAGGIIGIIFFLFTIASGPLQFIHFAQLLQKFHFSNNEEFMDGRSGRYMRHLLRGGTAGDASRSTRLSYIGNKFANSAELKLQKKSGLKTVYHKTTGRVIGYEMIDRNKAAAFLGDTDLDPKLDLDTADPTSSDFDAKTINMVSADGKPITGAVISMLGDAPGTRRKFTRAIVKGASASKIAGSLSSRLLIKRGGVTFHPLNKLKIVDEKYADWRAKRKKERADADRNGSVPPAETLDSQNPDDDGDGNLDEDSAEGKEAKTAANAAKTEAQTGTDTDAAKAKTKASINAKLVGGAAAFIGIMCMVKEINNNVEKTQYANIIMPMMRVGFRVVATGNQVMSGNDVSLDELRVLNEDMYDAEKKLGWSSARSIQAEQGEELTGPDIPATAKPSRVGGNPFSQAIDDLFSKAGSAGSAVCSKIGNIILTVGEFSLALATGGITQVVTQVAKAGVMIGASTAGINPMDMFTEWLVDTMAGKPVNVDAKGPDLGNIANYGARLAANDQAIASGGVKLSDKDVALLDTQTKANQKLDMQQKSFFARVLDINEPSSVASKAMFENRNLASMQAMFSSLMRLPLTLLPNMANMFSRMFTPSVYAASHNYDYGFDEFGFSQIEQDDKQVDDPFANAAIVEPRLAELNKKYGKCFSTTINPTTFVVESGKTVNFLDLEKPEYNDCRDGSEILLRYRFYIADTLAGNAMACYEVADAESCGNVGFEGGNTSDVATSSTATSQIDVGALGESSATIACAVDTTDKGVIQSKYDGEFRKSNPLMIRLCQIPDLPGEGVDSTGTKISGGAIVNSRVSAAWSELAKAAKAAGVSLTASSSFRLNNSCNGTGDGTACAQPGKSPHQLGVAIDFQGMGEKGGSSTSCTGTGRKTAVGNAGWDWLYKNAGRFGLKQYSYEPWHWDPLPLANRCGTI